MQLKQCELQLEELQSKISRLQSSKNQITEEMTIIQKSGSEITLVQRSVSDNLKYRELSRNRNALSQEISSLKVEYDKIDKSSVKSQRQALMIRYEKLTEEVKSYDLLMIFCE